MQTVELFSGTKSFSKMAEYRGHEIFTVDLLPETAPHLCVDIMDLNHMDLPTNIDFLWASPPCECFSVASIGKYWNTDHTPKNKKSADALKLLIKLVDIIDKAKPKVFMIENPRGKMRKMSCLQRYIRHTVTYCQYGDTRMKPTDLWSNKLFELKPPCKNGASCHVSAPRGSATGTQGIKGYLNRSKVPEQLCFDILQQAESWLA